MEQKIILQNFTNCYQHQTFWLGKEVTWLNCTDISGTNGYCDEAAEQEIKWRMQDYPVQAVHWIDGGNYHYVSRFWTDRITETFDLIVFDNHTDMQQSAFGDILSCGSWIRSVLERNKNVGRVILLGVKEDYAAQIEETERVTCISTKELETDAGKQRLYELLFGQAVYLSIDKDVLSPEVLLTDWDQGSMTYELLEALLKQIVTKARVLGVDICGECAEHQPDASLGSVKNNQINERLFAFFGGMCFNRKEKEQKWHYNLF